MKKAKSSIPSLPNQLKYNRYNEKEDFNLENIVGIDTDEVDKKLKEIDSKIESIGNICDKKKQKTLVELSSILKKEKEKIFTDLDSLNEALNDTIKQNTRDHYLNNLKKEVAVLKQQVMDQDKQLSGIIY
jgi:hypothetical protein